MPPTATAQEEQIETSEVDPRCVPGWTLPQPPSPKKQQSFMTRDVMEFLPHIPAVASVWRCLLHASLVAVFLFAFAAFELRGSLMYLASSVSAMLARPIPMYRARSNSGDFPQLPPVAEKDEL